MVVQHFCFTFSNISTSLLEVFIRLYQNLPLLEVIITLTKNRRHCKNFRLRNMVFNYIVFTGCIMVICHGQDNLNKANSLLRQELQIQKKACEGVAKMEEIVSKVTEFTENEIIIWEEELFSAKLYICEVSKKTEFLVGKLVSLEKSVMYNICFKSHQCDNAIPALENLVEHLKEKKEKHNAAILLLFVINVTLPRCSPYKMLRELNFLLKELTRIWTLFLPLVIIVFIFFSCRHVYVSMLLFLAIPFFFPYFDNHKKLVVTFHDEVLPFDLNDTQTLKVITNILCDVRMKRKFKDLKTVLSDHIWYGKKNAKRIKENLSGVMKSFQIQSLLENLKDRGYSDLANEARYLQKDFKRYLEELIKTLKVSQYFYNYAADSFKVILESQSKIETWQMLLWYKNIRLKSQNLKMNFSIHEWYFNKLIQEIDDLEIRHHHKQENVDMRMQILFAILVYSFLLLFPFIIVASIRYRWLLFLLFALVPMTAIAMTYVYNQSDRNAAALWNLKEFLVQIKNYSRKTVEQIPNVNPMKITEEIGMLHQGVKDRLSYDTFQYYFKDALDIAKENLNEIDDIIRKLLNK
ncbi:uncharacterized protein LOC130656268 [Hydractinia symbiolongicarpus]|uniref:uncharacterized protein LOC130656268 n=1 Tax=Hydractinia symbiolongicarpus TaxID=13093 RepID=UPI00254EEC2C|nr:uncharacterized protein LOC130656268 [Hydractinia symbiolongicarpus]